MGERALESVAVIVMGQSPPGDTCSASPVGHPLLNGPTEFGSRSPTPAQWTTAPARLAEPYDLLLCVRGSTTGRMNRADQQYAIGRGLAAIRGESKADTDYINFAMRTTLPALLSTTSGSVFPNLSSRDIKAHAIPWPDPALRVAIAEVLGALDDKIDANERAVQTSLDLADALYADWRSAVTTSTEVTFSDLADVFGGSTPKTDVNEYWEGDHAWAVPRDVTALTAPYLFDTQRHISDSGLKAIGNRLHPAGAIFMTSRATIGAFAVTQRPCAANQGFIVAVPREPLLRWFLFHEMRARVGDMLDLANGSTFLELSRSNFKAMRVVRPRTSDLQRLQVKVGPLHDWCAVAVRESAHLTALRDRLLPPLIFGELRVRDAQALVGEAV